MCRAGLPRGGVSGALAACFLVFFAPSFPTPRAGDDPPEGFPPRDPWAHAAQAGAVEAASAGAPAPWVEVFRYRFKPSEFSSPFAVSPTRVYAFSSGFFERTMYALDREDLSVAAEIAILPFTPNSWPPSGAVYTEREGRPRLFLGIRRSAQFRMYDASDPDAPLHVKNLQGCHDVDRLLALPGDEAVMQLSFRFGYPGDGCFSLFDAATGAPLASRTMPEIRSLHLNGIPGGAKLALLLGRPQFGQVLRVYDLSDPASPAAGPDIPPPDPVEGEVLITRDGATLLYGQYVYDVGLRRVFLMDPSTGLVRGVIEESLPGTGGHDMVLAEGGGRPYLVLIWKGGLASYDISDPAHPQRVGGLEIDLHGTSSTLPAAASSSEPVVFLTSFATRRVVAFDAASATVAAEWASDQGTPFAQVLIEDAGGRTLLSSLRRVVQGEVIARGGKFALEKLDWTVAAAPERDALYVGDAISDVREPATLGGRYILDFDSSTNTLALVDAASGDLVQTTGFGLPRTADYAGNDLVAAAGRTVAVAIRDRWGVEVFDFEDGRLVPRSVHMPTGPVVVDLAAREDGVVAVLAYGSVVLILPDGREISVPLEDPDYLGLDFSPDGRRLLVHAGTWSTWWDAALAVIGVDDPAEPVLLWERRGIVNGGAVFARNGAAVLSTEGDCCFYFAPVLFDTETGERLGDPAPLQFKSFYHGLGTRFGEGPDERMAWWAWSFIGWWTYLYDVSADTPALVVQSPEYFVPPDFAPRADGRAAYELHQSRREASNLWLVETGGAITEQGRLDQFQLTPLRHGFLAGGASLDRRTLVLHRDPAMNRPPVADAGPDQALECAGPGGTPAVLDGRGSSDPDSTPGTQDDIAAWSWSVDGAFSGDEPVTEALLDLGDHAASLEVTDRLDATGTDQASVRVQDTLPPEVALTLDPIVQDGVFAHTWAPRGNAADQCDGDLGAPEEQIVLNAAVLAAPAAYVPAEADAILVFRDAPGLRVELRGPDEAALRALWSDAAQRGGLAVTDGAPVRLLLLDAPPRTAPRDLIARYDLTSAGALAAAEGYEPGADHTFRATARDRAGHTAAASVSLRQRAEEICGELPEGVGCAGG